MCVSHKGRKTLDQKKIFDHLILIAFGWNDYGGPFWRNNDMQRFTFPSLCQYGLVNLCLWRTRPNNSPSEGLAGIRSSNVHPLLEGSNPFHTEASLVQGRKMPKVLKTIETLSFWYSLESSRWVLSDEYPYARVSVIFQLFCIILYWPN